MGIASRLVCRLAQLGDRLGPWGRLAVVATGIAIGLGVAGHLQPASEPVLLAPLRWRALLGWA
jgi:hypothetical protein